MSKRHQILRDFYQAYDEDIRVAQTRHGQLEYLTTMEYIHRHAPVGGKILEIGAGTGRYSIALAREGFDVTAVELLQHNLDMLLQKGAGLPNLHPHQGDAIDLRQFPDNTFDTTLVLGPMYHLYESCEVRNAIMEALRVTKPGGTVFFAFLSVYAIISDNYLQGETKTGLTENFTEEFQVRHFTRQLFTGYDIAEFETLFQELPSKHLTTVAADGTLELAAGRRDFTMSDDDFAAYARYHLAICEKRELLGTSSHLLYICRKI